MATQFVSNSSVNIVNSKATMSNYSANSTIQDAAIATGLHPNTIRNWIKQGRIKSAQQVIQNNVKVWLVDLQEVRQLAGKLSDNTDNNTGNTTSEMPPFEPQSPPQPEKGNSLNLIPEKLLEPLANVIQSQSDLIKEQGEKIADLSLQLGKVQGRLEAIEENNQQRQPQTMPERSARPNIWKIYFFVAIAAIIAAAIAVLILKFLIH